MKIPRRLAMAGKLIKQTVIQFIDDNCIDLGARLSYYTALSLAPLVILALMVAGLIWDEQSAAERITTQMRQLFGDSGAAAIEGVMQAGATATGSGIAAIVGIVTLLFAATVAFASLQETINGIWRVKEAPGRNIWNFLRKRLLSLATMGMIGFLMLVSLIASSVLSFVLDQLHQFIPVDDGWVLRVGDIAVSLLIYFGLFAFIFKVLPDVKIAWKDVWIGAGVTAVLFELGKTLIGLYIANSAVISAYGAATSLVAFLVWVYYSSLIVFFGAEFTQVYATRYGKGIEPDEHAVALSPRDEGIASADPTKR
ncbi:MAG: YihY/virulence factor BrkB family protein [Myxococcales bacterium]|nr:YihY/virulence factor BrkB family protein [Myxococcales bacterium]